MKNVPESEVRQILKAVQTVAKPFAANYSALSYVDEVVTVFSKTAGKVALVGLAAVFLAWECYSNMKKWWAGEISGKRCAKNCIDSFSGIAGGVVGGVAGAAIGSAIFPVVGTCVAGILGGLLSAWSAKVLSDAITRKIFDIPKDQALENAYNFLKVHHTASNNEINKHFHQLCFKHHPDKGGKHEDFLLLQYHMATIKISREESGRLPVTAPPKQIMCNCQNQSEQQKSSSTQLQ
ncbi:unnamed protein product [Orchesella dallaii]|uniref:J domain-containing protein n=1 Tax=Orchesella dallaii TaxID=48710 RepID=A0ABP1RYF5_9HEXA